MGLIFNSVYSKRDENGKKIINELVQETHRQMIRNTISQEKIYKNYSIHLLINRTTTPFITSDNPIIKQGGIKFKDTTISSKIFFPISPYHCLLLTHPKVKCSFSEVIIKKKDVIDLNNWQYISSNKYIITNYKDIKEIITQFGFTKKDYLEIPLCLFGFKSHDSETVYKFFI